MFGDDSPAESMLFNSFVFVFAFLPLAFFLFWYAGRGVTWRLSLLTAASYVFYSWWDWRFTSLMLIVSTVDYWAAHLMGPADPSAVRHPLYRKLLLVLSLTVSLGLLAFFKYFGFFTQVTNQILDFVHGGQLPVLAIVLPVGISFFTFESISYTIDVYRGVAKPAHSYLDYACFISVFPRLVAGPIIRYSDILHQFREDDRFNRRRPDWNQVNIGLVFFVFGMAKKILVADRIADEVNPLWAAMHTWVQQGCVGTAPLGLAQSWVAVLGYTFQIYFDFSGYSDMAVGLGHLFALKLPQNFNSPYKATDPSDFWRRWHISLSTYLRDYLYIPLGGNRGGKQKRNLMITMLLGGLWHGAAWQFIVWGGWHGLLLAVTHVLRGRNWLLSNASAAGRWINRQVTFALVIVGWVLFRSGDVKDTKSATEGIVGAKHMFLSLLGANGTGIDEATKTEGSLRVSVTILVLIVFGWLWVNFMPNSFEIGYRVKLRKWHAALGGVALAVCVLYFGTKMDFLYFRF